MAIFLSSGKKNKQTKKLGSESGLKSGDKVGKNLREFTKRKLNHNSKGENLTIIQKKRTFSLTKWTRVYLWVLA